MLQSFKEKIKGAAVFCGTADCFVPGKMQRGSDAAVLLRCSGPLSVQRLYIMQNSIAANESSKVQKDIEPIIANIILITKGKKVASTIIATTIKSNALTMITGEYLRRLEQVEVRHRTSPFILPHFALRTAVTANKRTANARAYGIISLTNWTRPKYQISALAAPNNVPSMTSTKFGMQNRLFTVNTSLMTCLH